jgi:general secretion pathway protein C
MMNEEAVADAGGRGAQVVWRGLSHLVTLALLILVTQELGRLTWRLVAPTPHYVRVEAAAVPRIAQSNAQATSGPDVARIGEWHLFGEVDPAGVASIQKADEEEASTDLEVKESTIDLPDTQMKLELVGLISPAVAFIKLPKQDEALFHVGDVIKEGGQSATLVAIQQDGLILDIQGRRERLLMPRAGDIKLPKQVPTANVPKGASRRLKEVREMLKSRPQDLLSKVQVVPYSQNGKFQGFQLNQRADPRFLRRFGLQSGDVVTEANGVMLTDPMKGMALLSQLTEAETIQLKVLRGGKELAITLEMDGE